MSNVMVQGNVLCGPRALKARALEARAIERQVLVPRKEWNGNNFKRPGWTERNQPGSNLVDYLPSSGSGSSSSSSSSSNSNLDRYCKRYLNSQSVEEARKRGTEKE